MEQWHLLIVLSYSLFVVDTMEVPSQFRFDLNQSRRRRQSDREGCTLPSHPEHGQWKLLGGVAKPGDKIPRDSVLKYGCNTGYILNTEYEYLVCDEKWPTRFPDCEKLCPSLYSSTTFELKCRDKRGNEIKCSEAADGTYVEYKCASSYETPFGYKKALLCTDGKWNQKPVCQPVCGKKIEDAKTLIVGSKPNKKIEYPWLAAIYQHVNSSYKYICGGSVLSLKIILTAAHCVTNDYGDTLSEANFRIGVGKLYSQYNSPNDQNAQYLELYKILVHEDYKGDSKRYLADIAILVVKNEIALSEAVQPICFNNMNTIYLHPGSRGNVSGWGKTDAEDIAEVLRTLQVPLKDDTTCTEELDKNWANKFRIVDKICAGHFNKNMSVCDGDSGSGLVFLNTEDNRYYIHGIVSLGPQRDGHCDIQQNTLYTKVAFYYEYIDRLLTTYAPIVRDCVLPAHPKNGKWTTETEDLKPGDAVPASTVLKIECNVGFKLSSVSSIINCGSTDNMPVCQELCPPLYSSTRFELKCRDRRGDEIKCSEATDGSYAEYKCAPSYTTPHKGALRCINGKWNQKPLCQPFCGKKIDYTETLVGPESNMKLEYPWVAALYKNINNSYKYLCGATVLSSKIVVTAAHCVTNEYGDVLPEEHFHVGVGKLYSQYNSPNDTHAQYLELLKVIVHEGYKSQSRNFLADIAVLVVKEKIVLGKAVQPICFNNINTINLLPGMEGKVSGWRITKEEQDTLEILDTVEVPFKDDVTCIEELPTHFADKYKLIDKICAGHVNKNISVCDKGSGNGLVFLNEEDNRFYIHGIASLAPLKNGRCDIQQNILYTKVAFYYEYINRLLTTYVI